MANEIKVYYTSGLTLYSVIRNASGQAWDTTGEAFETWNTMTDYDIALTDKSGGMYVANIPATLPANYYTLITYQQAGANPADSDPPIFYEKGYWDTTVWATIPFLDEAIEGTLTVRQIQRLMFAVLCNKSTGGGTATISFRDRSDAKNRIIATVDTDGNRTAVTVNGD